MEMRRREVLRGLLLCTTLLSSFVRKAAAANTQTTDTATGQGSLRSGLPSDWRFISPRRWNAVDRKLRARSRTSVEIGEFRIARSGRIEIGSLDPIGNSVALPESLKDIVRPANEVLSLEALNLSFNPYLNEPTGSDGNPLGGPFHHPEEIFQGKAFLPVRLIMTECLRASDQPEELFRPLLDALSEVTTLRTPAHQFQLDSGLGNRIVFYGTELDDGTTTDIGHKHIDLLVTTLSKLGLRIIKQMVHFDSTAQGGTPDVIVGDGVGGVTHAGGFSAGYDEQGHAIAIRSDWPSNYGHLGDAHRTYNAHLLAIDYAAGTEDSIPEATQQAYYQNADMWDCAAAMLIPFADEDPDPIYRNYEYNPLEVFDQASARSVAAALAQLNRDRFFKEHGAFYCAEGQYVVANLGPQEDAEGGTLLKKSRFGDTPFGQLITNFTAAPEYADMAPDERRKHPFIGWDYLRKLGRRNGGIRESEYETLAETVRLGVFLDWIPEDVKGWQAYRPKDPEGLIARPMTVATMAWGLFRNYMPREGVARVIMDEIGRCYRSGNENVKSAVTALCGGENPESPEGQVYLASLSAKAATGFLLGILASDEVRKSLLNKAGYFEITNEEDRGKVQNAYDAFLGILQNADYSSQTALDRALMDADAEFSSLSVKRRYYNRVIGETEPAKTTVMKYAAPFCFGLWAQQPFFAETGCLRYVATAMHVSTEKRSLL